MLINQNFPAWNLRIETIKPDSSSEFGWYMGYGVTLLAALEDALTNYQGLRQIYLNLWNFERV